MAKEPKQKTTYIIIESVTDKSQKLLREIVKDRLGKDVTIKRIILDRAGGSKLRS